MKQILFLTNMNNTMALKEAAYGIKSDYGDILRIQKLYFNDYESSDTSLDPVNEAIKNSDIIILDVRGDFRISRELPALLEGVNKPIVVTVGAGPHLLGLTKLGKFHGSNMFKIKDEDKVNEFDIESFIKTRKFSQMGKLLGKFLPIGILKDMRNWILAQEYYYEGDADNLKNLLLHLLKNYGGMSQIKKVPAPTSPPGYGLYVPGSGVIQDLSKYKILTHYNANNPTIGLLLYDGMHFNDTRPIADAIYDYLKEDVNLVIVCSRVEKNIRAINQYLTDIDLFVNLQYFRIHGGPYGGSPAPTYKFFKSRNVPYLLAIQSYETEIKRWQDGTNGLNPLETVLAVILPELDGAIEPIYVAGLVSENDSLMGTIKTRVVLKDRIERLCQRIKKWLILREKLNDNKQIALITYNYPPGEDNLASAGYLDVFESLKIFLKAIQRRGYTITMPPEKIRDVFLSEGIVNNPSYLQKTTLGVPVSDYTTWFRTLPDMVQNYVIKYFGEPPGNIMVEKGKILIPGVILGNIFLGVQPSRGVHEDLDKAYHDRDLPPHHQYLAYYYFLQHKFQADAIIHFGMHGTLEFTKGKEVAMSGSCFPDLLIGNIPHVYYYWVGNTSESTIAKRRSYALPISHASPPMKSSELYEGYIALEELLSQYSKSGEKILPEIIKLANELNLSGDPKELERELYRMKKRLIPDGLHIMNRKFTEEQVINYLLAVLRLDRQFPSILKLIVKRHELVWEEVRNTSKLESIEKEAKMVIEDIIKKKGPEWVSEGYKMFVHELVARCHEGLESETILNALEGKYIFPALGGDPIRDPEVYPSGRSMYAFDPRKVPTITAEIHGKLTTDLLIKSYYENHNKYPETVGIVLWGFETMKTGGDTIATILNLLGIKINQAKGIWFKELEIIPLEELGHPRIDVVITICGIFRDTFGTHIDLLGRAVEMVAQLDESHEQNYVRKHYLELKDQLGDLGMARIFGPASTEYATSITSLVESGVWQSESDLAHNYEDSLSHAYFRGKIGQKKEIFGHLLESVDLITQERDNSEYEITDLDHYYEFLGGMAKAVKIRRNQEAEVLVVDSTEEELTVEDIRLVIERATRTRLLNPSWLKGMLQHDFHGAKKIRDRTEYLLGLAATTNKVENWVFDKVADRLVFDEEMHKKLQENNIFATMKLCELLVESSRRGYWEVDKEKLNKIKRNILDMENSIEG